MKIACIRKIRPSEISEGAPAVIPTAAAGFFAAATITQVTERSGGKQAVVTPTVGDKLSLSVSRRQVEGDAPNDHVFVECDPSVQESVPIRLVDVVGFRFGVTVDVPGAERERATRLVKDALEQAGLTWRLEHVSTYADMPVSTAESR